MSKTKAPKLTPSPSSTKKSEAVADRSGATQVFISMVLDMSWRLALVVLIPVLVGVYLDDHYGKGGKLYVILGLLLAVAGASFVVYRSYRVANRLSMEELTDIKKLKERKRAS